MQDVRSSVIISIFSTTPGNGKTITAINLSVGLAMKGYKVCLADLDLQFGNVVNYLQLSPHKTLSEAQKVFKANPEYFNIEDFLIEYRNEDFSFSILPAPRFVSDAYQIDVLAVDDIIGKHLNNFDFVILDLNSAFSALNIAMLDLSTIINYVGAIDFLPALKNFKVGYDTLLRFEYEKQKIRLVENRADSQKLIQSDEVERLLGERFFHRLPNDYPSVSKSINSGKPLVIAAPESKLTKSFAELTARYTSNFDTKEESEDEQPVKKNLFSRTLKALFG